MEGFWVIHSSQQCFHRGGARERGSPSSGKRKTETTQHQHHRPSEKSPHHRHHEHSGHQRGRRTPFFHARQNPPNGRIRRHPRPCYQRMHGAAGGRVHRHFQPLHLCVVPSCFKISTIVPPPKKNKPTHLNGHTMMSKEAPRSKAAQIRASLRPAQCQEATPPNQLIPSGTPCRNLQARNITHTHTHICI